MKLKNYIYFKIKLNANKNYYFTLSLPPRFLFFFLLLLLFLNPDNNLSSWHLTTTKPRCRSVVLTLPTNIIANFFPFLSSTQIFILFFQSTQQKSQNFFHAFPNVFGASLQQMSRTSLVELLVVCTTIHESDYSFKI